MTNKLIIPADTNNKKEALVALPMVIVGALFILYVTSHWHTYIISSLIRSFCYVMIIFFAFGFLYTLRYRNDNTPLAILDEQGIWTSWHGLIVWQDIDEIFSYNPYNMPIEIVAILLKDPAAISKKSNLSGKMSLFWSKLFRTPHVQIGNAIMDSNKVVRFAQQYLAESTE